VTTIHRAVLGGQLRQRIVEQPPDQGGVSWSGQAPGPTVPGFTTLFASCFDELVSKADWICEEHLVASRHLNQPELPEPA
jgi:hypothetical protein